MLSVKFNKQWKKESYSMSLYFIMVIIEEMIFFIDNKTDHDKDFLKPRKKTQFKHLTDAWIYKKQPV